ncbi:MAG: DUF91 domain-containing protein [Caldilineae bacterium]|nr:DUF91 domain-containing protein [Caldilineae bacterium]
MATEIKTWQIINGKLVIVETTLADSGRKEALDLEAWIASNPAIIGSGVVIIGRQVQTKSGPLDLLAIDRAGNIAIIELKRDILPREALAQAIDYASDIASWSIDRISEICAKYTGKSLDDVITESFPDANLENVNVNETQRIMLVGFAIEPSLERMINWLSNNSGVNINAVILKYTKTRSGDELLTRTSIISEEVEQDRISRSKFHIPMSDDPGEYEEEELAKQLRQYLRKDMFSAKRIRRVLLPVCLKRGRVTREQLKQDFVTYGEAESVRDAGYFLSLISQQVGMAKNDFLRQIIGYEYPNYSWEKDNYHIREGQETLVRNILDELDGIEENGT